MTIQEINQQLADEYMATLKNRNIPHDKVFLIFSGVPGSGKTTLALRLRDDLKAQYVRHDDIRSLARRNGYDVETLTIADISKIAIDTMMLGDANKFMILDASLDRTWPIYFASVKRFGAIPIIIRLDIPKNVVIERIKARDKEDFGKFNRHEIDTFYEQFENCKKHVPASITLGADYDYESVLRQVRELL